MTLPSNWDSTPVQTDFAGAFMLGVRNGDGQIIIIPTLAINLTFVALQSENVTGYIKQLQTVGYATPFDYGGARYVRVSAEPSHPGKLRTLDRNMPDETIDLTNGGWWEIQSPLLLIEQFGGDRKGLLDSAQAVEDAFRTHLAINARLLFTAKFRCSRAVTLDPTGYAGHVIAVDAVNIGNCGVYFDNDVATPLLTYGTPDPSNNFYGYMYMAIEGNSNGLLAQIGHHDRRDPTNGVDLDLQCKNSNAGDNTAVVELCGWLTCDVRIVANGGGTGTGAFAVRRRNVNNTTGLIACGQSAVGLIDEYYTNGNVTTVNLEVLALGYQGGDATCQYNHLLAGDIANVDTAIDNAPLDTGAGYSLIDISNLPIAGYTNKFANETAGDATWGGTGVRLRNVFQSDPASATPAFPAARTWVKNKSCQPVDIDWLGTGTATVYRRAFNDDDNSLHGQTIATSIPAHSRLNPGEAIMWDGSGSYGWSWWADFG